jgi:hypothetical protein
MGRRPYCRALGAARTLVWALASGQPPAARPDDDPAFPPQGGQSNGCDRRRSLGLFSGRDGLPPGSCGVRMLGREPLGHRSQLGPQVRVDDLVKALVERIDQLAPRFHLGRSPVLDVPEGLSETQGAGLSRLVDSAEFGPPV